MFVYDFAATLVVSIANLEGEETFEASMLGSADEVVQERICDDELILVKGWVRVHLHLFIRCKQLSELFSPRNRKKMMHNPISNQIASMNAPS